MSDPWEQFEKLKEAIAAALPRGVTVEHWAIMPDHKACNLVLHVEPEAFKSEEDLAFEKIVEEERVLDHHASQLEKVETAKQKALRAFLEGAKDDTPDE